MTIDSNTGEISGEYDAGGFLNESETFPITVYASIGTSQISKSFNLSIRNDG